MKILSPATGRKLCWFLVLVDVILGGLAVFFPNNYALIFHPRLSDPPIDFIVRTGVLWLIFIVFQVLGAISPPEKVKRWQFVVAVVRLMEVQADVVYGILAIGATPFSRFLILSAPIMNTIFGLLLLRIQKEFEEKQKIEKTKSEEKETK